MMRDAVRRADTIIRGMLDFSRPAPLRLKPGSLADVIESSLLLVEKPMESKRIHLTRTFGKDVPQVSFDENQMKQVFINLISNAGKYCEAPDPALTIRPQAENGNLVVDFIDNGPGIPTDQQAMIFEKFSRIGQTKAGGAGLGLAICREIMGRLGGDITYLPGQEGAAFRVVLPLREAATVQAAQ